METEKKVKERKAPSPAFAVGSFVVIIAVLVALLLVTYVPFLSLAIPNALKLITLPAGFNMFFVGG